MPSESRTCKATIKITLNNFRGLEKNKLRKFGLGIFFFSKAKNAGDAAHQRVFLTQQKMKMEQGIYN